MLPSSDLSRIFFPSGTNLAWQNIRLHFSQRIPQGDKTTTSISSEQLPGCLLYVQYTLIDASPKDRKWTQAHCVQMMQSFKRPMNSSPADSWFSHDAAGDGNIWSYVLSVTLIPGEVFLIIRQNILLPTYFLWFLQYLATLH